MACVASRQSGRGFRCPRKPFATTPSAAASIEQAKGVIAERTGLGIDGAFFWLQEHASSRGLFLIEAAQSIVDGTATPDASVTEP
jgi:hypothetical protein